MLAAAIAILALITSPFANLQFRNIGPDIGRIDAVSGASDGRTFFAGGLGGLWRTTDEGATWSPVFERYPVTSIGAVTVAPSNPKIVYVGTGEPNIRNDIAFGDGVYRSEDGGSSWKHLGLDGTSQIAQIAVDPHDANIAYIAAVGDPFRNGNAERGIYKTVDGGKRWARVLHPDDATGASSVAIDPANPRIIFAGLWSIRRTPWSMRSGGARDGVYRSTDAGTHWARLQGNGLPSGLTGRIGLGIAPSDSKRIYALIESRAGVLWRSDDGGRRWSMANGDHQLAQRPYYFSQLTIDPVNRNHVFFLSVYPMVTFDGGKTAKRFVTGLVADHHQLWIDPRDPNRMIVASDFGPAISHDNGKNWRRSHLLVGQSYHMAISDEVPYTVCAEFQDPGAACGPSLSFSSSIDHDQWIGPVSGESGWIAFEPSDNNLIYGTGDNGAVLRYDRRSMQTRVISPWPVDTSGAPAAVAKYRGAWVSPLIASALEPHAIYYGANVLFKTVDDGTTWTAVSGDLTRNDKSKQQASGGPITPDNAGTEYYDTISTIAESPLKRGLLWVGTDDGLVWRTDDGGTHWNNVTANVPALPEWARINYIAPSNFDAATAYMVVDEHKLGIREPLLYVTRDGGAHWRSTASNLPRDSYARIVREDPVRRGMLYAGTESGLWLSFDDGGSWYRLQNNIPNVPVYDVIVQPRFDDLIVGTHGRSLWILDDISPLQQLTPDVTRQSVHLFTARPAYRWAGGMGTWATYGSDEGAGDNPRPGADINFFLHDAPPKGKSVKLEVYDGTRLLRTLNVAHAAAGINRTFWDLGTDEFTPPALLKVDTDGGFGMPQAAPGEYTVRITYSGITQTQRLTILQDPRSKYTLADIQAQNAFALRLRDDIVKTANEIVALSKLRATPAIQAALERLYQPKLKHFRDDLRYPPGLYEQLAGVESAAVGGDAPPPQSAIDAANELEKSLNNQLTADRALFAARYSHSGEKH